MKEVDTISGLLEGPRARGAFTLRAVMEPPWSLRVLAESPLTVIALVKGSASIKHDNGEHVQLEPGDVAITRAPGLYTVADDLSTPPTVVIHPGQDCRSPAGESLGDKLMHGVRTWGNDPEGSTLMLVGGYESVGDLSDRLRHALPPLLWVKNEKWESPLIDLLSNEMAKDAPGQAAVLDRLLDLLLIAILRAWSLKPAARELPWYQARGDRVVSHALKLMHADPAQPWTVSTLASKVGVSRAALARRFNEAVGESPIAFLTQWRLALAADLLHEPDETIGTVAERVGYSSPYALSSAFKRVRGMSPSEHRRNLPAFRVA